jgi:hypothetical protein
MINSEGFKQDAEHLSTSPIRIRFQEMLINGFKSIVVFQPADSDLIDGGIQLLPPPPSQDVSYLYNNIFSNISKNVGG